MDISYHEDYKISDDLENRIINLLSESFAQYPANQSFLNQRPSFRYLSMDKNDLAGHLGVESRVINIDDQLLKIFGIVDLCIDKKYQEKKIASNLIAELEKTATSYNIDFIILFTANKGFYLKQGFEESDSSSRWLMIQKNRALGVARRTVADSLMYKQIGTKKWPQGEVDLLGHIF